MVQKSGTSMQKTPESIQKRVFSVLTRDRPVDVLGALIGALQPLQAQAKLSESAIILDANVFLRLASHKKGSGIIDYMRGEHSPPIILPGQTVQEFWNNQLVVVETMESIIRKDVEKLTKSINAIGQDFSGSVTQFEEALRVFAEDQSATYSSATVSATVSLLEMLRDKALVAFCNRQKFCPIAAERKQTKTPPGFKDTGDGDFFVWVEALCALGIARNRKMDFASVILVTNDKKEDWSRGGVPHPILAAELKALYAVPLEMWTLDKLAEAVPA